MSIANTNGILILSDPSNLQSEISISGYVNLSDVNVKVHPVVLFSILDHYLRRPENQVRVIGTLLGKVYANTVEVTNCFAVPHQENNDEVAVGKDFNKQMYLLSSLVSPSERIVGWYATSFNDALIVDNSTLIHEFFTTEIDSPVHLVVDTAMKNCSIECKAYISTPIEIAGEALANVFKEIRVELDFWEAERICVDRMVKGQNADTLTLDKVASVESQSATLELSMKRLLDMLQYVSDFVDKVVKSEIPSDPQLGRLITDTLAYVPKMQPDQFGKIFDRNLQDLLMVSFLSSLTKTQIAIAEKLSR